MEYLCNGNSSFSFLPIGDRFELIHNAMMINAFCCNPISGSPTNLYLCIYHREQIGSFPLLGCQSGSTITFYEANGLLKIYMLLAGDFNALPDAPEILLMNEDDFLCDLTAKMDGTFHDYGKQIPPEKIDYIAATRDVICSARALYTDYENGIYLSDHYPVMVVADGV